MYLNIRGLYYSSDNVYGDNVLVCNATHEHIVFVGMQKSSPRHNSTEMARLLQWFIGQMYSIVVWVYFGAHGFVGFTCLSTCLLSKSMYNLVHHMLSDSIQVVRTDWARGAILVTLKWLHVFIILDFWFSDDISEPFSTGGCGGAVGGMAGLSSDSEDDDHVIDEDSDPARPQSAYSGYNLASPAHTPSQGLVMCNHFYWISFPVCLASQNCNRNFLL